VLILMVAAALWFRDVELPAYQVASLPSGADPMTIGDATELLLVPFTLAVVAYVFSAYQRRQDRKIAEQEHTTEREIAQERNEEAELQTYFDRMSELMLTHDLRPPSSSNEGEDEEQPDETKATALHNSTASTIARARTLAVLRSVKSSDRKGSIVRFLYESGLIHKEGTVVDLRGADLSGADLELAKLRGTSLSGANLRGANLSWANLSWANLFGVDLDRADLELAKLRGASLGGANLRGADLFGADLSGASLGGAKLCGANLRGADLSRADLSRADLSRADLHGAKYNKETTPPPGGFPDSAINVDAWDARKAPNNDDTHAKEQ
jgi:uncharacterized protein YjbI with pentapeptide repeats